MKLYIFLSVLALGFHGLVAHRGDRVSSSSSDERKEVNHIKVPLLYIGRQPVYCRDYVKPPKGCIYED
ncbi:unnamed protein product, partial [Mesorhabditis spiculigera]